MAVKFFRIALKSDYLVREIVKHEQSRDDNAFAGKKDEYLYEQGYTDGIRFCLRAGGRGDGLLLVLALSLLVAPVMADTGYKPPSVTVSNSDNSVKGAANEIKFNDNLTVTKSGTKFTIDGAAGGGGGGASTLEVFIGTARSSPTASITANTSQFSGSVSGSTFTFTLRSSSVTLQGNTFNGASQLLQADGSGLLPAADLPTTAVQTTNDQTISGVKTLTSSLTVTGSGGQSLTYGLTAGSVTVNNLTASQYVTTDAGKQLASQDGVPTTDLSGTLADSQFPALTGDITTSAGSLATTAAATQANIKTLTSSLTVTGAGGFLTTYGATLGSATVNNLSASLPVQTDSNKQLTSAAINLSGSQVTGTLSGDRFPALTGDITTSAGNLATTAAATQGNIKTFTSSVTVTNAAGAYTTYNLSAGSLTLRNVASGTQCLEADASGNVTGTGEECGAGGGGYATVADEGSDLTQRATINFTGAGVSCADNGGSTRTDCTISGGGTPAGPTNSIQYNDSSSFGGSNFFSFDGSSVTVGNNVITSSNTKNFVIENVVATDSGTLVGLWNLANVTISRLGCVCYGTCTTTAEFGLENGSGTPMTVTAPTCGTVIGNVFTGGTSQPVTANNTLTAGNPLRLTIANTPVPTTDTYILAIGFRINK